LNKSETKVWEFLEELVEKTLQWETMRDESLGSRVSCQKGYTCNHGYHIH